MARLLVLLLLVSLALATERQAPPAPRPQPPPMAQPPAQARAQALMQSRPQPPVQGHPGPDGEALYATHCAACHGAELAGQPRWNRPNAEGRLPAPPLDGSGHAWQHSDAELADMVARSMVATAPPGYQTDMPAFAGTLSPAEITAVVEWVKSRWPIGTRASQALLNPDGAAAFTRILAGAGPDVTWTFPPACLPPGSQLPE